MDIIENIKKRSTELTRKQYMVAKYMIDHPDEMAYITLKELSRDIGVTEITILNTCASLGYEGFTQIKYEFRKDIIQKQKTDVLDESSVYTEKVPKYEHDNREKVLAEIGDEEVKAITDYWKNIDLKKYFEAADLILNSKQIFICGRGISWTMAEYMKNRLSSCEVLGITANTELNDDVYGMLTSLTEESLLIPISFPDYYFMTTKVTERARMQNAKILAITDRLETAVAQCADLTLTAPTMTRVFLNTLTSPMLMLNLLTSAIKLKQGKTELNEN